MAQERFEAGCMARRLLEQFGDEAAGRGSPVWLLARPDETGELDLFEVTRAEGLLGYVVGHEWPAAAVVATGRFRSLDDSIELPAACRSGLGGGLRLACVVTRDGEIGWQLELPDGTSFGPVPEEGVTLDVLRRSLGLPTTVPVISARRFHLLIWLDLVLEAAVDRRTRLSWPDVVEIHMAEFGVPLPEGSDPWVMIDLVCGQLDWESVRLGVANSRDDGGGRHLCAECFPPPDLAEWMDAGMFERWVTREWPRLADLLAELGTRLHSGAYRRICRLTKDLDEFERVA